MIDNNVLPILHVDGSLTETKNNIGEVIKVGGIGGYLLICGKVKERFSKNLIEVPYINYHEEYAIIEGLKWIKEKNIDKVQIRSDSISAIKLFTNQKRNLSKTDKFFLMQYLMLDFAFEHVEFVYQNRDENDLAHDLSRKYIKEQTKEKGVHHIPQFKEGELGKKLTKQYLSKSINEINFFIK